MAITLTIGIVLLIFLILSIRKLYKEHNYLFLIPIILIAVFLVYTFGTTKGALRFAVLWTGHPIEAYQTDFKEYYLNNGPNKKYYSTTMKIEGNKGEELGLFEVNYYWIFKISKYYGY